MLRRIYALTWALLIAMTASLFVGGHLDAQTATVIGFFTVTQIVIGMSILLPMSVSERLSSRS